MCQRLTIQKIDDLSSAVHESQLNLTSSTECSGCHNHSLVSQSAYERKSKDMSSRKFIDKHTSIHDSRVSVVESNSSTISSNGFFNLGLNQIVFWLVAIITQ